jgi:outer membrane protein assembly factor BamB
VKKLLNAIFIIAALTIGKVYGAPSIQLPIPELTQTSVDFRNVFARTKNLIIIRSFASSIGVSDPNSRESYLEAYNIHTGDLVWCHTTVGMIVTFMVVDEKIIYRNYQGLTALNSNNGAVIWSKKTQGEYSTINGE